MNQSQKIRFGGGWLLPMLLLAAIAVGTFYSSWYFMGAGDEPHRTQEAAVSEMRAALGGTGALLSDDAIQDLIDRGFQPPVALEGDTYDRRSI